MRSSLLCLEHRDKKVTIIEGTIGVSVVGSFGGAGFQAENDSAMAAEGSPCWKVNPQLE